MGLIQRADLPEKIRRAFGIRELGVGSTLSPEIVPVALVEDLTGPTIDEGYPRQVIGHGIAGASTGVLGEVFLICAPGSIVDLVVHEIWIRQITLASSFLLKRGKSAALNNLLGTQPQLRNTDVRTQALANSRMDSRNQAAAIVGTTMITAYASTTAYTVIPISGTLGPGDWFSVHPESNDKGIEMIAFGYERLKTTS